MNCFGSHLKEAGLVRVELERELLAFEEERATANSMDRKRKREKHREERHLERHERREERLQHSGLEMEKH